MPKSPAESSGPAPDAPLQAPPFADPAPGGPPPGLRALFAVRPFAWQWSGRAIGSLATQAQAIALGWQVYAVARLHESVPQGAFTVGMLGLVQFVPMFITGLFAGETADRYDRRTIMGICLAVEFATAAGFAALAWMKVEALWPVFALAAVFALARAFYAPAASALAPSLVPRALLPRAVVMNSLAWQLASVVGPAVGGLLIAVSPVLAFGVVAVLFAASLLTLLPFRGPPQAGARGVGRIAQIREGLAYVWGNKIVLGAISLDLFAVLLGGATALLPVFARDILHVGAQGYGVLRAAPAVGGVSMGAWLATRPIRSRAGLKMFLGVGAFGAATVVFALSKSMALSVVALAVLGGGDMISVFVRQSLVQIVTPADMRGRVSAVSYLFIGATNELGEFETGVVARLLGPIGAAAFGGVGSLVVTGLWAALFAPLRNYDRLE
jgi:MFS family permease